MCGRTKTPEAIGWTGSKPYLGISISLAGMCQGDLGAITEGYSGMTKNTKKAH